MLARLCESTSHVKQQHQALLIDPDCVTQVGPLLMKGKQTMPIDCVS